MDRKEFLRQLRELLSDVQESERWEAISYYENYFDDAGPEKEAEIIEELGSPRKVADSIKKDLFGENYKEAQEEQGAYYSAMGEGYGNPPKYPTRRKVWIAVCIVLTFPIWIGVVGGLFGGLLGLLGAIFGVAVALLAVVFCLMAAGIILTGVGFVKILTGVAAIGCIVLSIGLFLSAIGILGIFAAVWCVCRFFPWFICGIVCIGKRILKRLGAAV